MGKPANRSGGDVDRSPDVCAGKQIHDVGRGLVDSLLVCLPLFLLALVPAGASGGGWRALPLHLRGGGSGRAYIKIHFKTVSPVLSHYTPLLTRFPF